MLADRRVEFRVKTMLADAVLLPIVFPIAGERFFEPVHVSISFDFHHPSVTRFAALADDALGNVEAASRTSVVNLPVNLPR